LNLKPQTEQQKDDALKKSRQGVRLVKATSQLVHDMRGGSPQLAISRALVNGMKLAASDSLFYNSTVSPLVLAQELKKMGIHTLAWEPEILMAEIDRVNLGWTPERIQQAITYFHRTGTLDTEVPALVRNKIYALRLIATSDTAHSEWNVFEKVGGAFNDRVPQFGMIEPMTAAECARTVLFIENIRPDSYTDEVKIYIAACCHNDGLYTVAPIPALKMAEPFLKNMIREETGDEADFSLEQKISEKYRQMSAARSSLQSVDGDDIISAQALRLLAVNAYAHEGI
jgi:hypothetical protein